MLFLITGGLTDVNTVSLASSSAQREPINTSRNNRRCISPVRMVTLSDEENVEPQTIEGLQFKGVSKGKY
jgi:hypothetical protein